MSAALALLGWLALGLPAALAFARRGRPELAIGVAPFAGALSLWLPVAAAPWLDADLAGWAWRAALAALLIGLAAEGLLAGREDRVEEPPTSGTPRALAAASVALLLLVAGYHAHLGATLAQGWPGYEWDGLAIWLVRAKVIAASAHLPVELFREEELRYGHWDYPLALPSLLAWFARFGGLALRELPVAFAAIAAIFPLAAAAGAWRTLGPAWAGAVALAPQIVPQLLLFHYRAYADPAMVMAATAGLVWTVAGAVRWDRASLVAGGLALAVAVSLKNEGVLWLCAIGVGAVLLSAPRRLAPGPWAAGLLRAFAPPAIVFLGWQLTCRRLEVPGTLLSELRWDLVGERFGPLLQALLAHLFTLENGPILVLGIAAAVALARGPARARLLAAGVLLALPAAFVAGLFVVYVATPHGLGWHVTTSLHRTVYGVTPAVLAVAAFAPQFSRVLKRSRS